MIKSLADNPFITEAKDKNGDSWYHQIILEEKDKEIERLNNILDGYEKEMDNLIDARDKAIEYIELRSNTNLYDKNKLLEILKGSDKSENKMRGNNE